jgi:1-acyl-sn-glycerol-3-phosphate acyltransferase
MAKARAPRGGRVPVKVKASGGEGHTLRPSASRGALTALADRVLAAGHALGQAARPGRTALAAATDALTRTTGALAPRARVRVLRALAALLASDAMQPERWRAALETAAKALQSARAPKRPLEDEYGLDPDFYHALLPIANAVYTYWFRVDARGVEHVPVRGRAMLVPNHSGTLAFDGAMISSAIWEQHRSPRPVRWLFLRWFSRLPFVSTLLSRTGCVLACRENGERLLAQDHLVGVFPEGQKGGAKLYRDRYRLQRFGRGGFVRMALRTRAPILPIAVVGAEEIYPAIAQLDWLAKPLGLPVFPITPTFPWLGPLGLIPLPSRWAIRFCEPIRLSDGAPAKADDEVIVGLLTERVRRTIQEQVDELLQDREGVFF